jgi:hypothetical protein
VFVEKRYNEVHVSKEVHEKRLKPLLPLILISYLNKQRYTLDASDCRKSEGFCTQMQKIRIQI